MTIYDLDGVAFYEAPVTKDAIVKCTLMGDYYIELPFAASQAIDFKMGYYVLYDGRKFDLIKEQFPEINSKSGGYKYTLRFEAQQHHMRRRRVFWLYGSKNEAVFHNTTTLDSFGKLIADNMNAFMGEDRWFVGSTPLELATTSKVVSFNGDNCWDAINKIAETFDVEWWIEEANNSNYIHFGKCEFGDTEELRVGDAITDLPIKRGNDANYGTRFYVFGSTRNLTDSYNGTNSGGVTNHVAEIRLRLPDGIEYIDAKEDLSAQEIIEQVVFFEDVYPKNTDVVTSVETVDRLIEGEEDTEVEIIQDEAVNLNDVTILLDDARLETQDGYTIELCKNSISVGHDFLTSSLVYYNNGVADINHSVGELEVYRGEGNIKLYIEVWDSEDSVRYSKEVVDQSGDFSNSKILEIPYIDFDWSDDIKPLDSTLRIVARVFFEGTLDRYDQPEDFAEIRFYNTAKFVVYDNAAYGPPTFKAYQVVAAESPFLPSDVIPSGEFKIKFTSGYLIGQEFGVDLRDDEDAKIDPSTWTEEDGFNKKFEIIAQIEENGDGFSIIPNENLKPEVGDTFVLTGVELPSEKIRDAEEELLSVGTSWANKNSNDTNVYDCPTNPVYCAKYGKIFEIGQKVVLIDDRLREGRRESRIQGFEKKLWREYIATYSVGDNTAYSRIGQIEDNIKENAYVERSGIQSSGTLQIIGSTDNAAPSNSNVYSALASDARYIEKSKASHFVKRSGDAMTGPLLIQAPDVQLTLTGDQNDAGDYCAAIVAESVGEHYGGVTWTGEKTNIEGGGSQLHYNDAPIPSVADMQSYVNEKIDNIVVDVDLSDVSITEEVEVAEDASIITTSDFSDTPIAEEIVSADEAETLTYGEAQRHLRVFEYNGLICLASSHQIYDDEKIALARKLSQGWSGKQGWSISQQFASDGGKGDNPTYEPHLFTLAPWLTPNPKQPNGLYYYKLTIDGNMLTPSTLLSYFISSLDGRLQIYWGKRAKKVAFGADTSGNYKRAASLRYGVAVGNQIAPFKLVVQSKCFDLTNGNTIYLDSTTWPQCVQFRV